MANVGKAIRKGPLSARRFYDLPMTQSALANTLDNRLIQEYPHSPVIVLPCSSLPGELLGQDQAVRESGPEDQEDLRGPPTRGRFADEGSIDRKGGDGGIDIESGMVGNYVLGGSTAWRGECRRRGKTCPLTRIEKGRDSQCFCFVVEGQEPNQKHLYRDRSKVRFREFPVPAIPFSVCSHSCAGGSGGKKREDPPRKRR